MVREEGAALAAEIEWALSTECGPTLARVRKLMLPSLAPPMGESPPNGFAAPVRCGKEEDGLMVAAVVSASALHAMRVQVELPKWFGTGSNGVPYSAVLSGGQRVSVQLPTLLGVQNRVAQALGLLGRNYRTLRTAHEATARLVEQLSEALYAITLRPPPAQQPSSLAPTISALLQPAPPPGLLLDVCVCGRPPRLYFSAYLMRDGAVADARHTSLESDEWVDRVEQLEQALRDARSLLAKLDALSSYPEADGEQAGT